MTPHELREVGAGYFLLPSPCLAPVVESQIILPSTELNPVTVDLYGDALMNLPAPGDAHWRVQHDAIADAFRDHCVHDLGIAVRREVDDLFQHAVPLGNTVPRDEVKDLVPDAELSLPAYNVVTGSYDPRSLKSTLLEFKTMRYGVKYTAVPRATAVDRFESSLLGDIQRGLAALDAAWHNTEPGQKGPLRDILDMSEYTGMVFGTVGEPSPGLSPILQLYDISSDEAHRQLIARRHWATLDQYRSLYSFGFYNAVAHAALCEALASIKRAASAAQPRDEEDLRLLEAGVAAYDVSNKHRRDFLAFIHLNASKDADALTKTVAQVVRRSLLKPGFADYGSEAVAQLSDELLRREAEYSVTAAAKAAVQQRFGMGPDPIATMKRTTTTSDHPERDGAGPPDAAHAQTSAPQPTTPTRARARARPDVWGRLGMAKHPTLAHPELTQQLQYLDMDLDLVTMQFRAPTAKLRRLSNLARDLVCIAARRRRHAPARLLASLAGQG
eukprot:jgi/Tetstr1/425997/TSEL_016345.t1